MTRARKKSTNTDGEMGKGGSENGEVGNGEWGPSHCCSPVMSGTASLADGEVTAADPAGSSQPHVHHGAEHRQQGGLRAGLEGAPAGRGF